MTSLAAVVDHIQVTVPRAAEAEARRFYGAIMGLSEIPKPPELRGRGGAWYQAGTVQVHVSLEDVDMRENMRSRRHVSYIVSDLEEARQILAAAGVAIIPDEQPTEGYIRFYVRDPGGNRVEIAQCLGLKREDGRE